MEKQLFCESIDESAKNFAKYKICVDNLIRTDQLQLICSPNDYN